MEHYGFQEPVTEQPGNVDIQIESKDCPAGLEPLVSLDELILHGQTLYDRAGTAIYQGKFNVDSTCGLEAWNNGVDITITTADRKTVMVLEKDHSCACFYGCCWFATKNSSCAVTMAAKDSYGQLLHTNRQGCDPCRLLFSTYTAAEENIGTGKMPWFYCPCFSLTIPILAPSGTEVGVMRTKMPDQKRELFKDDTIFTASFCKDLDVQSKAAFVSGLFLASYAAMKRSGGAAAGAMAGGVYSGH